MIKNNDILNKRDISDIYRLLGITILLMVVIFSMFVIYTLHAYLTGKQNELITNIVEYNEVDFTHLCNLSGCQQIYVADDEVLLRSYPGKQYIVNDNIESKKDILYSTQKGIILYDDLSIGFVLEKALHSYFVVEYPTMTKTMIIIFGIFIILAFLLLSYTLYSLVRTIRVEDLKVLTGSHAQLTNKNIALLTENIHHEMKTPLTVIQNQVERLGEFFEEISYEQCTDPILICNKLTAKKPEIKDSFEMVNMYVGVIYAVLERMSNYKTIKYSSEDKSIYDIAHVALYTLEMYFKNKFTYLLDEELKLFYIGEGISNEMLLNIFINHLRNSLEANATAVHITMVKKTNTFVFLNIQDNGNGIPINIKHRIFHSNFSTKEKVMSLDFDGGYSKHHREHTSGDGIGLFYSKLLIVEAGGDDVLLDTDENGTTFGLKLPYHLKKEKPIP